MRLRTLVVLLLLLPGHAFAAAGALDPSFAGDGIATLAPASGYWFAGVAVQPDQRIVAVGSLEEASALARHLPDGSLDASFGTGGLASAPGPQSLRGVVIQPDGRIVVMGSTWNGAPPGPIVARYEPDGTLDATFATGGVASLGSAESVFLGEAVLSGGPRIDAEGNIFVSGELGSNAGVVIKFQPDGRRDPFFGTDGIAVVTDGFVIDGAADLLLLLPSGRIMVLSNTRPLSSADFGDAALLRLRADGSLDPTFNAGGTPGVRFVASMGGTAFVRQPDGRIVLVGFQASDDNPHVQVARVLADGTRDATFAGDGVLTMLEDAYSWAQAVTLDAAGRVLVAGISDGRAVLIRIDPDGTIDRLFGTDGVARLPLPGLSFPAVSVALQADGRILTAGSHDDSPFVARWLPDGVCAAAPRLDCKTTAPRGSRLKVLDGTPDAHDQVVWTWSRGEATTLAELGDPLATTSWALCLYAAGELVAESAVPPGGTCGTRPCWKASGTKGFVRTDRAGATEGVTNVLLRTGDPGDAKAKVKAMGDALVLPPLPLALPLAAQLQATNGTCLGGGFSAAGVRRNDATQLSGVSD